MTVVDGKTVYRVWWNHKWAPKSTLCLIKVGASHLTPMQWDAVVPVVEEARLNPRDTYNRNTGRRVALKKALKSLFPTRMYPIDLDARRLMWQEYHKQLGHW